LLAWSIHETRHEQFVWGLLVEFLRHPPEV
jgi:hypothetical protein